MRHTHRVSVSGARTAGIRGRRDALRGTATGSGRFLERVARKLSTYPVESGARLLPRSRITPAVVSGRAKGAAVNASRDPVKDWVVEQYREIFGDCDTARAGTQVDSDARPDAHRPLHPHLTDRCRWRRRGGVRATAAARRRRQRDRDGPPHTAARLPVAFARCRCRTVRARCVPLPRAQVDSDARIRGASDHRSPSPEGHRVTGSPATDHLPGGDHTAPRHSDPAQGVFTSRPGQSRRHALAAASGRSASSMRRTRIESIPAAPKSSPTLAPRGTRRCRRRSMPARSSKTRRSPSTRSTSMASRPLETASRARSSRR